MTMQSKGARWMAMALVASLALATIAPAAEAGRRYKSNKRGHGRTKVVKVVRYAQPAPRVIVHRHSDGDGFATFIGGLFLGAAISHIAHEASYADDAGGNYYWDPYCHERFVSLEIYHRHFRHHRHPRVVRVVTVRDDRWIDSLNYGSGGWGHCDDDWNRGNDRGYDYEGSGYYGR